VSHNEQRLQTVKYFRELLDNNKEAGRSIGQLLRLSRETITRLQKADHVLISFLERDPLLCQ